MKRVIWMLAGVLVGQEPPWVDPGGAGKPPADAIVLFDGKDLSHWVNRDGEPINWEVRDGVMVSRTNLDRAGRNHAYSREKFSAAQVHVEFNIPLMAQATGQARGNSGVYLMGRYEIQILDSYQNSTYANGMGAALYGQRIPLVNASRLPDQWQTYDIIFHPPKCHPDGYFGEPGRLTLLHNGVVVHAHVPVQGSSARRGGCVDQPGPLMLQDHHHPEAKETPMRFRNIWVRELR